MTAQPRIILNDQNAIPQIGLGVWQTPSEDTADVVATALEAGYRHVDTAAVYRNEKGVGEGVRRSGLPRDEVYVTTKIWNDNQGYDATMVAFEKCLGRLQFDYVDLLLIHWPSAYRGLYVDTWKALVKLKEEGRARSIGVSNFDVEHLERITGETGVVPVLNQIELHPTFQQRRLREAHAKLGIATESWSPLGRGKLFEDPTVLRIAAKYGRTTAQVVIRWHLDSGLIVIPKSVTPSRIVENLDSLSFRLDADDMAAMAALDTVDGRCGPDPNTADF
ncbi:MAG: aldo/keto reductase [Alphaproteobacteria bacterium]|nr:MAG: aldo/keto reductase [Alphaproteobacteria bacterium]